MENIFKSRQLWVTLLFFTTLLPAKEKIKVACIGNSITFGIGTYDKYRESYPSVLSALLGDEYDVRNFGVSARTLLLKGDNPYRKESALSEALQFDPNIVIIKLGTNDSKPNNWIHKKEFSRDMDSLIADFAQLTSKPKIFIGTPAYVAQDRFGITEKVVSKEIIPAIRKAAKRHNLEVIDFYSALYHKKEFFSDGVHPNTQGARLMALTAYQSLTGQVPQNPDLELVYPGAKSKWKGYDRYDFIYGKRKAIIVAPSKAAQGSPWMWRPAFFGVAPWADEALLALGFHIVHLDVTHAYGSPSAINDGVEFYNYMTKKIKLSTKVTLEGYSRGGFYALRFAALHPDKVACVYIDAPVCDLLSWPGRKQPKQWNEMLKEWNLSDDQMNNFRQGPAYIMQRMANANIPVLSVCGDSDKVVPHTDNTLPTQQHYLAVGGSWRTLLKPGVDHHPHGLTEPAPIVDFVLQNQPEYFRKQHFTPRGQFMNSLICMAHDREASVAFLGGSITEMNGWRNLVCESLRQRFPNTQFTFIAAGIGSTGSTPGAFRLVNDILSKGKIDLLFVEAAVNDHTNQFTTQEQIRGMEGIIRHARLANPNIDIIMQYFIFDPFIPILKRNETPSVILTHEQVAQHYNIPSINQALEIEQRMSSGEFTWKEFGGTHPAPLGHRYYAATINRLLDTMWNKPLLYGTEPEVHPLPSNPIDTLSYYRGRFIPLNSIIKSKGFNIIDKWMPNIDAEKRNGFFDVQMLSATTPGASFMLKFKGTAIGVFCAAGPDSGILEYRIDNLPWRQLDLYTPWSEKIYLPWVFLFDKELNNTTHTLEVRMSEERNPKSKGTACYIRNIVAN